MAAGQATRLRPLTDNCPKCLLSLGRDTILARAVRLLAAHGLNRFTIVDGFCGDMIRSALATDFPDLDFTFICNEDYRTTNNAWSLMLADCQGDEPVFLLDSDIVFAPEVLSTLLEHPAENRLGLRTRGEIGAEEMKVRLDASGQVVQLSKDIPVAEAAGESVGLEVFSARFVADLSAALQRRMRCDGLVNEYYEAAFTELAQAGHQITPVDLGKLTCLEIDTAADLAAARREFGA